MSLIDRFHTRWPVWSMASDALAAKLDPDSADAVAWDQLDAATIGRFFSGEPARMQRFLDFASRGHIGIVMSDQGRWVAYGWLTTPRSGPAEHLPNSTRGRYWIFYCRTAEDHQNRGHYRRALVELGRRASAHAGGSVDVFIDTREDNVPARRAIERLGFLPRGVMHLLRLPRTPLHSGIWRHGEPHPGIGSHG